MAIVNATKNGNWSDPTVWNSGAVPVNGDTVSAVSFTVDLDVDIVQPLTTLTATSGFFRYAGAAVRSVTAIANLGTHTNTNGLIQNTNTGTLVFNGPVSGGSSGGIVGARNVSTGTLTIETATGSIFQFGSGGYGASNASTGTLNCGNAIGGLNHEGVANLSTGTVNITNAIGGQSAQGAGFRNIGNGTANVGTSTGSSAAAGSINQAAGTLNVDLAIGNNFGPGSVTAATQPGVVGSNALGQVTRVKRIQFGPFGAVPVSGAVLLNSDSLNTAQFRIAINGATKTLADPATFADSPIPADVRAGTEYNYGNNVGTCAVPLAGQTVVGVPVDDTVGTAVLTQEQLLATLQPNPVGVAERSVDDDKPLTFSWPNSTDIITGEVSIDNGEYVPVLGSISYLRPEGNKYHYTLSYNTADRPTEEGIARYKFSSNNNTMYATLRITQTYTDEFATSVELMNSKLSSSTISIISPLSSDGTTLSIIQGDDYLTIDNRNILFTGDVTDQWVDLTDATVIIGVYGTSISKECVVISATGMQQISLELTSSDTNIPQGTYDYDVQATLSNGSIITLFRGKFTCSKSYTN